MTPARLFERRDEAGAPADAPDRTMEAERAIVCARCGAPVARERDRMSAFGSHEHDRVNPAGYLFRIACFARADGAVAVGAPSDEFPWFPNHRWRVVVCGSCFVHLGWSFAGAEASFFGLVVDRIAPSA